MIRIIPSRANEPKRDNAEIAGTYRYSRYAHDSVEKAGVLIGMAGPEMTLGRAFQRSLLGVCMLLLGFVSTAFPLIQRIRKTREPSGLDVDPVRWFLQKTFSAFLLYVLDGCGQDGSTSGQRLLEWRLSGS